MASLSLAVRPRCLPLQGLGLAAGLGPRSTIKAANSTRRPPSSLLQRQRALKGLQLKEKVLTGSQCHRQAGRRQYSFNPLSPQAQQAPVEGEAEVAVETAEIAPVSPVEGASGSGPALAHFLQTARPVLRIALAVGIAGAVHAATGGDALAASRAVLELRAESKVALDTVWVLFCSYLVIFMNAGFALVESGMCRVKNTVNILAKNLIVFALAVFAFYMTGFGLLFGDGNAWVGLKGFFLQGAALDNAPATLLGHAYTGPFSALAATTIPITAKFFFQAAFSATAATIVSGAVAERVKFFSFCLFSLLLVGISYPITGHWVWGGGWLSQLGFFDFAGCTTVHSVGGWAALIGAAILGPRLGRYGDKQEHMPPHNFSMATLGCLILWLGWFGFNPGSTMAADPNAISHIAMVTNLGGCAGAIAASSLDLIKRGDGKTDLGMIINGVLAGLVAVTAACPWISAGSAALVGAIGGIVVVTCIDLFNRMKLDDPVSAVSVHLGCGIWGTLAVGLFAEGPGALYAAGTGPARGLLLGGGAGQLGTQVLGIMAVGGFTVLFSLVVWAIIKATMGLRVTREEELNGLDEEEHGQEAYVLVPGFEPVRSV